MIPADNSGVNHYYNVYIRIYIYIIYCTVIESIPFLPYINEPGWFFMVRSWQSHAETASPAILALAQLPTSRRLAIKGLQIVLKMSSVI